MRINSQECVRCAIRTTGTILGALGGAAVAVVASAKNPVVCKAITDYITGTGGSAASTAMNCMCVEVGVGASAGAAAGWKLADLLAQRILKEKPHLG